MRTSWRSLALLLLPSAGWPAPTSPGSGGHTSARFTAVDRAHPPATRPVLAWAVRRSACGPRWPVTFPGRAAINRGFGGRRIADATFCADRRVAPYHPRVIVFYAGDNDLAEGCAPAETRAAFAAFVQRARSLDAGVPIAFITIQPSMARKSLLPRIRQANALVRDYARGQKGVGYPDVFTPMLGPDGSRSWNGSARTACT